MPIGNDVVDLDDPACQPDAIHPRFDNRAFTPEEIGLLQDSGEPHLTRWSLWAAKESTFKACKMLDPTTRFLPRDFLVRLSLQRSNTLQGSSTPQRPSTGQLSGSVQLAGPLQTQKAEVAHRLGIFTVWLDSTKHWVHALASQSSRKPGFLVQHADHLVPNVTARDPSALVRQLARPSLGSFLNAPPSEIQIGSDRHRIPRVTLYGNAAPVDLSMSHDGRFVACAWEKQCPKRPHSRN